MGCFFACFGSSKDRKRRNQRKYKVLPPDHRHGSHKTLHPILSPEQGASAKPELISEVQEKLEDQLSLSTRKKVTFDTNVRTYEPVLVHESAEVLLGNNEDGETQKGENSGKSSLYHLPSEDDSITSSVDSYPLNHRYQNCRDSDDEGDEFNCEDSDLDDEDGDGAEEDDGERDEDDNDRIVGQEVWSKLIPTASMESSTADPSGGAFMQEVDSRLMMSNLAEQEAKTIGSNINVRDRSVYVHPVLNPVENITQWKAVKSKGTSPLKTQKENFGVDQEATTRISFSSEPTFKQSPFSFKSKLDQSKNQIQEIAVDASLSNWLVSSEEATPAKKTSFIGHESITAESGLVSSEATSAKKTSFIGHESITSESCMSQGSNSVMSIEDRPILGALTVEELKQLSASSSRRRSPSRSPDDMPIIGTVGTYWSHIGPAKDSGSASSFKGIPNTTSKYREDKTVNWHSTPFETRLERALNRSAAAD